MTALGSGVLWSNDSVTSCGQYGDDKLESGGGSPVCRSVTEVRWWVNEKDGIINSDGAAAFLNAGNTVTTVDTWLELFFTAHIFKSGQAHAGRE